MSPNTYQPSPPYASGVVVTSVPGKGRGLVAKVPCNTGHVLIDERPFRAVLLSDVMLESPVCSGTFLLVDQKELSKCSACQVARYSSKAAQAADWRRGHKQECKAFRTAAGSSGSAVPHSLVRLIARLLWSRSPSAGPDLRPDSTAANSTAGTCTAANSTAPDSAAAVNSTAANGSSPGSTGTNSAAPESAAAAAKDQPGAGVGSYWQSLAAVEALEGHLAEMEQKQRAAVPTIVAAVRSFMGPCEALEGISDDWLNTMVAKIVNNAFSIHEAHPPDTLGLGIYPFAAMLNHSNRPNCAQSFVAGRLCIKAIRSIQAGDELCISYCGLEAPTFQLREKLLASHRFDTCPELACPDALQCDASATLHGCINISLLSSPASKQLLCTDAMDEAHCAFMPTSSPPLHPIEGATGNTKTHEDTAPALNSDAAGHSARFGIVKLEVEKSELHGLAAAKCADLPDLRGQGFVSEVVLRDILREDWEPGDEGCSWTEQVFERGWVFSVQLFGAWPRELGAAESSTARAACGLAFVCAALRWASPSEPPDPASAEEELFHRMTLKAGTAGRSIGLADSHMLMREVLSKLAEWFVRRPVPKGPSDGREREIGEQSVGFSRRLVAAARQVYPEVWAELAWLMDQAGEVALRSGHKQECLELWSEASRILGLVCGDGERSVARLRLKLQYFREERPERRFEMARHFGHALA